MSTFYNSKIYNAFLKEMRTKHHLTTQELASKCYLSVGTVNMLENSDNILTNKNTEYILKAYSLPERYLTDIDFIIKKKADQLINGLIYMEAETDRYYQELKVSFEPYKDTILYFGFTFCTFIYDMYNYYLDKLPLKFIEENKYYLGTSYTAICNLYLGQIYFHRDDNTKAQKYFSQAKLGVESNPSYMAMLHYCLSTYYVYTDDFIKSITHSDLAIKYFTETLNMRRLMNTNIIKGLQYLKIRDFSKALQINRESLNNNPNYLEKRIFLNNMAYIYLIQEKFEEALKCFEDMPQEQMLDKHYLGYMFTLYELAQYNQASSICQTGLAISNKEYYTEIFQAFQEYFNTCDLNLLGKKMSKIVKKYQDILNDNELEEYYGILYKMFKKSGHYKKSLEYLEKIHQLSSN